MHEKQLKPHLQCGTDPRSIRDESAHDLTTHETVSHPSHRRGRSSTFGDGLCMEKHRLSCICYLSKTHFVRDFLQNSIGNSSTSTTCNPIYSEGTILELQITIEFHRQLIHQHHLQSHLHCGNDPTVANHNGIIPSVDHACTKNSWNPIYNAEPIRDQSETNPPMIRPHTRTVSQPSHRRGRSSTFGDALCMEKHRLSCICYLSKTHFVRDFLQNSIGNSSTSTTCNPICSEGTILELQIAMEFLSTAHGRNTSWNPIYIAGTILQLQITMEFRRPQMHEKQLKPHLQCGTDPRPWSETNPPIDPTTHETVSHPSHRRGRSSTFGDGLCMEKHRLSCICYLSKTHFVRDFLQNSIGNSSTSTTGNPIYSEGTILQLQITMGIPSATHPPAPLAIPFTLRERSYSCKSQWNSVDRKCTKNSWNPIYNARTDPRHDPRPIRPHTRPSRNRRTAEVDHRGSGTDFVWKNIGFRASAISQKRISCETSSKTPSATPPPAPLAIPFTVRERSYRCKSQWNSVDRKCTKNSWNPIYNAEPIRTWSETVPTTHETVSHPSHRRGRSSRFGDGLCMEKHRLSCICYLSKTHFVRDFLQNSIGNSSTSTTCNPIYSEGTILQLQITMEFCRPHMDETQLKPHFTMRKPIRDRSENDPRPIRPHTRPSRNRRTAEVDHRGSGTDFVWKNIGFRASAISQKRISCETSSKTPSATPPPAPLAIPFTVREQFLC